MIDRHKKNSASSHTLGQLVFEVNDLLAVVVGALQRIKIFKQLAHLRDAFLSASLDVEWK